MGVCVCVFLLGGSVFVRDVVRFLFELFLKHNIPAILFDSYWQQGTGIFLGKPV